MTGIEIGGENATPIDVSVDAKLEPLTVAPLTVRVDQPLVVNAGGGATPLAANVNADVAATVTATATAGVTAELKAMPDVNVRLKEVPRFTFQAPTRFRLGFSIFGFELFAFTLHGEAKLESV